MRALLRRQLPEVLQGVAPLVAVTTILQVLVVRAPMDVFLRFLAGSALAAAGLVLLFAGIELGILPMGRYVGAALPRWQRLWPGLAVAFAFGLATTVAEPDVLVLADEVAAVPDRPFPRAALIVAVGGGVGVFTAIALLRVVLGTSMVALVAAIYVPMLLLTLAAPLGLVPLAYDAGSVTTGVLTAPVVLALARGFSAVLGDRDVEADSFGYLGIASAGAILVVLVLGIVT